MEPKCRPAKGPMRAEHEWDNEVGACVRCGVRRNRELEALPPRPEPRPVVAPQTSLRTAAARLDRALGAVRPVSAPVVAPTASPAGPSGIEPANKPRIEIVSSPAADDVATIPDPLAATLATLELERDELDVAIEVLKRQITRKAARA